MNETTVECQRCKWAGRPKSFLRIRKVWSDGSRSVECENMNCDELSTLPPENILPAHIPRGAEEKTDYVFAIAPYFKELAPETRFFAFDEKAYSLKPESLFNGKDWFEFCDEIATK